MSALSNRHNAQRRIIVLQRWKADDSVILNCDFEGTHITPDDVSEAIASGKYSTDQIYEVYECWPRGMGGCTDITSDVYDKADEFRFRDPEGDAQQIGWDRSKEARLARAL